MRKVFSQDLDRENESEEDCNLDADIGQEVPDDHTEVASLI